MSQKVHIFDFLAKVISIGQLQNSVGILQDICQEHLYLTDFVIDIV